MASAAHLEIDAKTLRRLSVDEYHRMVEVGVLGEDEHVELLEGVVVSMPPHGPLHAGTIQRLNKLLVRAAGDDWDVRCQLPLTLGDRNEPEPDLAVVRAGEGSLLDRHPTTARLVIEVTSSSGTADRGVKARLYASSGIAEYWIVDVGQKVIEVHLDPDPTEGRYRASRTLQGGDAVVSTALPGLAFEVGRLFA